MVEIVDKKIHFNMQELTDAIERNKKHLELTTKKLDEMSDDIKNLQAYLQDQSIHFEVKFHLFDEVENGAKIQVSLLFAKSDNFASRRILVERKNLITNDISLRVLEEYKVSVRMKIYNYLPAFVDYIGQLSGGN